MYSTPLSSKSVIFEIGGLRGSKTPKPPAIITIGAKCCVPLTVVTINLLSSVFSIVIAASPKVNPGLNGAACSIRLSTKSPAKTDGNPGIS
ncbi:hypothetical protein D3C71_1557350 [compost metagenome]